MVFTTVERYLKAILKFFEVLVVVSQKRGLQLEVLLIVFSRTAHLTEFTLDTSGTFLSVTKNPGIYSSGCYAPKGISIMCSGHHASTVYKMIQRNFIGP